MRKKYAAILLALAMTGTLVSGCGSMQSAMQRTAEDAVQSARNESGQGSEKEASEELTPPYFEKGVYANYSAELEDPSKTYFYVFHSETEGYTVSGEFQTEGIPFKAEQADGMVTFFTEGMEDYGEEFFITEAEENLIYGYFTDLPDRPMVFELLEGVDPDGFDAEAYVNGM